MNNTRTTYRSRRWLPATAALVALTLIAATCGGDDDDDAATTETTQRPTRDDEPGRPAPPATTACRRPDATGRRRPRRRDDDSTTSAEAVATERVGHRRRQVVGPSGRAGDADVALCPMRPSEVIADADQAEAILEVAVSRDRRLTSTDGRRGRCSRLETLDPSGPSGELESAQPLHDRPGRTSRSRRSARCCGRRSRSDDGDPLRMRPELRHSPSRPGWKYAPYDDADAVRRSRRGSSSAGRRTSTGRSRCSTPDSSTRALADVDLSHGRARSSRRRHRRCGRGSLASLRPRSTEGAAAGHGTFIVNMLARLLPERHDPRDRGRATVRRRRLLRRPPDGEPGQRPRRRQRHVDRSIRAGRQDGSQYVNLSFGTYGCTTAGRPGRCRRRRHLPPAARLRSGDRGGSSEPTTSRCSRHPATTVTRRRRPVFYPAGWAPDFDVALQRGQRSASPATTTRPGSGDDVD